MKQDRQGVRTAAGLERKYDLGRKFSNQAMINMTTDEKIDYLDRSMIDNQDKTNDSMNALRLEDSSIKDSVSALSISTSGSLADINVRLGDIDGDISRIDQNIGVMNTTIGGLDTAKVNKTDVVNNFTTTTEGKVADARTVKVLNDKFKIVRQIYSVTLTANAYCKPFSYFGSYDITAAIQSYGFPIGVYLYTSASVPMACYHSNGVVRMASGEASNTLVVDYLNGGYQ